MPLFSCCSLMTADDGKDFDADYGDDEVPDASDGEPEPLDANSIVIHKKVLSLDPNALPVADVVKEPPMSPRALAAHKAAEEAAIAKAKAEMVAAAAAAAEEQRRLDQETSNRVAQAAHEAREEAEAAAAAASARAEKAKKLAEEEAAAAREARRVALAEATALAAAQAMDATDGFTPGNTFQMTRRNVDDAEDSDMEDGFEELEAARLALEEAAAAENEAREAAENLEALRREEEAAKEAAQMAEEGARRAHEETETAKTAEAKAAEWAEHEAREATRIAAEDAEKAKRACEQARANLLARLSDGKGVKVLKHSRNGKSVVRVIKSTDGLQTITWGSEKYEMAALIEVRHGADSDPTAPGARGTSLLRRSKSARVAMGRSFSLIFPKRSLDFTTDTEEEAEQLVAGFRACL